MAIEQGAFAGASVFADLRTLVSRLTTAEVIGVNLPVGLLESGLRLCDRLAQHEAGPLAQRVLLVPPRPVLQEPSAEQAEAACRRLCGEALCRTSYALRDRILELDAVVHDPALAAGRSGDEDGPTMRLDRRRAFSAPGRHHARIIDREGGLAARHGARVIDRPSDRPAVPSPLPPSSAPAAAGTAPGGWIIEAHAELSFGAMTGAPLLHAGDSIEGRVARHRAIERAGIRFPSTLVETGGACVDDLLDAAAVAWTAGRYARGEAHSLPAPEHWQRDAWQSVAIWC